MGIIKQTKTVYDLSKNLKHLSEDKDSIQYQKAVKYIRELMQAQGGLYKKVLQYMGTHNEELEDLAYESFEVISQENATSIIQQVLPNFDGEILETNFSASIGQVNLAKYQEKIIAIKFRYPDIKEVLEDQLKLLKLIPKLQGVSPAKKWGFDFTPYQEVIQKTLDTECRLSVEAYTLMKWGNWLSEIDGVAVPKVYQELISDEAYGQEYIEGKTVFEVAQNFDFKTKRRIAENLVFSFLHLFFNHQSVQGDSNFGNYLIKDETLYYIDLGQAIEFEKDFSDTILRALADKLTGKPFDTLSFFQQLGFDVKKLAPLEAKLDLLITILLEPFIANRPFNLNDWNYKKDIDTLLGEEKWWFRASGGTDFFLFMKGFMGLKNLLAHWQINLNWTQILKEFLKRVKDEIPEIAAYQGRTAALNFHGSNIQVQVKENGMEKVKMTMPFMVLFDLEEFIDDEVMIQIENEGQNLKDIVDFALKDGGRPKELINIKKGHKEFFVAII